jgi:hypothetical protein
MSYTLTVNELAELRVGDAYVTEEFVNRFDNRTVMEPETFVIEEIGEVVDQGGGRFKRECTFSMGPYSRAWFALYAGPGGHPRSRIVKYKQERAA